MNYSPENSCILCNDICAECNGKTEYNCTKCYDFYYLYNSTCTEWCPDGYYADSSSVCEACDQTCLTCQEESTFCLSCNSSKILYLFTCIDSCPDNFYNYTISGKSECMECNALCTKCENLLNCTECQDNYYLQINETTNLSSCVSSCDDGYYQDAKCEKCPTGC